MRVLVQLTKSASVSVKGTIVSEIGRGFLLFVGFQENDDERVVMKMAEKVSKLRIFPDENGKTNLSLKDVGAEVLSVSQFTLYGDLAEGNRPSFAKAMRPEEAEVLFAFWNNILKEKVLSLKTGIFRAEMEVRLINDGPFTVWLDSHDLFGDKL